jgi:hypothetical protein
VDPERENLTTSPLPATLKVTGVVTVVGSLVFHYTRGSDAKTITLIVPKGTIKVNSKVLGTFDE